MLSLLCGPCFAKATYSHTKYIFIGSIIVLNIFKCDFIMRRKRFLLLTNLIHLPLTTYFADFTFTGTPEHHIKNVSKYTFGKLLKIVVLKHPGFVCAWKRDLGTSS